MYYISNVNVNMYLCETFDRVNAADRLNKETSGVRVWMYSGIWMSAFNSHFSISRILIYRFINYRIKFQKASNSFIISFLLNN